MEDLGRFEKALSDRSMGAFESNQLLAELTTIQERENGELRVCQRAVESRQEVFSILQRRLARRAKNAMKKLLEDDSDEEDGDKTIRGLGEDEGEEEDDEGEANAEAGGSGTRSEEMEEE